MNVIVNGETVLPMNITSDMTIGFIKHSLNTYLFNLNNYNVKFTFSNGKELSPVIWLTNKYDNTNFMMFKDCLKGGLIEITGQVIPIPIQKSKPITLSIVRPQHIPIARLPKPKSITIAKLPKSKPIALRINNNIANIAQIDQIDQAKPRIAQLPNIIPNNKPKLIKTRINRIKNKTKSAQAKSDKNIKQSNTKNRSYLINSILKSLNIIDHERIHTLGGYERYIQLFPTYQKFVSEQNNYVNKCTHNRLSYLVTFMKALKSQGNSSIGYMDMEGGEPSMAPEGFFLINNTIVMVAQR